MCDKRDKAISYVFCRDLHLTSMFSGLLQKGLFKGKWILAKRYFKQNYCRSCHTRFALFFPLPSCCVSSLLIRGAVSQKIFSAFQALIWSKKRGGGPGPSEPLPWIRHCGLSAKQSGRCSEVAFSGGWTVWKIMALMCKLLFISYRWRTINLW